MTSSLPTARQGDLSALAGSVFAAVLFDLDGTLIDSTPAVARAWVTWALERAIDPARLRGYHGVPARQIVADIVPAGDIEPAVRRIGALELADLGGVVPLPGAARALMALPERRRAIVTSCTRALAAARLEASALVAPAVVVTIDDVRAGKPDPEPFVLAARLLDVDPGQCLVIEDAPSGLCAARAAGMATLAVTTTTAVSALVADAVVGTLAEVRLVVSAGGVRVLACA